jgi:hypothetical protein
MYKRCITTSGKKSCEWDAACMWDTTTSTCSNPDCSKYTAEKACNADSKCYFTFEPNRCLAAQCISNTDLSSCEQGVQQLQKKPCIWDAAKSTCRQPTYQEQNAPAQAQDSCEKQVEGNLWWLWVLAGLIFLLLLLIMWRLYLAYAHGMSFFEPTKNTKKFNAVQANAAALFEESQARGVESNAPRADYRPTANKPSMNDL